MHWAERLLYAIAEFKSDFPIRHYWKIRPLPRMQGVVSRVSSEPVSLGMTYVIGCILCSAAVS